MSFETRTTYFICESDLFDRSTPERRRTALNWLSLMKFENVEVNESLWDCNKEWGISIFFGYSYNV